MMRKCQSVTLGLFFCFAVIYLFSSVAIAQKDFKIEQVDGVTVVSNPKEPIPKNGLRKRIVFKEELSIGEIEGDENYMFGEYISFNTDDEGNFYVSDMDNYRIQKYDAKGKYLLTIGRKGQGPGEFEAISYPRFDKDNNIYVYDIANTRISFFDRNGKFLRQINTPRMSFDLYINSKGLIIGAKREPLFDADDYKVITNFGLFDEAFKKFVILYKDEEEHKMIREGGRGINIPQMVFKPHICYRLDNNDYIYFGYPEEYEIDIYFPDGKLIKKIRRDYEQKKVSKKDREDYFQQMKEQGSVQKLPEHWLEKMIKMTTFAEYKPAYYRFVLLENGWLFIIVDYTEDKHTMIDLYNNKGRYIAQFESRPLSLQLFFKNGKAYDVVKEEGFPFVKRYAIELQEYKNGKWVKSSIKLF